ncbi:MAG TPA: Na+/H+ antiporter NhaC [Candidatus Gallibacteroides avistercoris]|uniref:Na+/H+ antiporter NhaC n=1 Tax=Candidatus Gallibacteroides avistercoris TaxID=2840833 RepID=A0A9D1M817_9BACT|nr:Na+/H+ antiporter NhaC [Candidatus Gallibacteroides avistercoris]
MNPEQNKQIPSPLISSIPVVVLVAMLFIVIRHFGSDTLEGGSQISLMVATFVCVFIAILFYKQRWQDLENAIAANMRVVTVGIVILLLIGAVAGTWMVSGVVPSLIYYGLNIIHPHFFLASTCIICSVVSVMTGSSWTTVATIGVALVGIGKAQGFDVGWIAGAIISGSYFGDKISPLSDTTVLASSTTGTPLFTHIRYMLITTVPSLLITLVIFTVAGLNYHTASSEHIHQFAASLKDTFHITPWLLVVPVVTGVMIAFRLPSVITLFLSSVLAGVFLIVFQPHLLPQIVGTDVLDFATKFKGLMISLYGNTNIDTGSAELNDLVSTSGMGGMLNTIWLIICAMCFGGVMTGSGMLQSITSVILKWVRGRTGAVASTVSSGLFFNLCTADQYLSIILTGNMFKELYRKLGLESRLLSRTVEDAVTVTSPLIPWNTCGMTQATVLGVPTLVYLPYCFFNLLSPLVSITVAAIGYKIYQRKPE